MRERDSIQMVILYDLRLRGNFQNPSSGLCFRTLGVRVGVFHLGWNFTSPTLSSTHSAWNAPQTPALARG